MTILILGIIRQKKRNVLKGIKLFTKIPFKYLSGICKIGIPTAIQGMVYCGISMVLTRMVSGFGAEAVAVQRVGGQIESVSWNTADGFGTALNAFIGQNYGAGKMDRVKKGYKASLCSVGIWGIFITIMFVFQPKAIAEIFFHESKAIMIAIGYLTIIGVSEAFYGCRTDDSRCVIRIRKNTFMQCDQHSIYQCKNSTCDHFRWSIAWAGRYLVGILCDINCKRNYLCMYILLDHERQRCGKNDKTQ